MRGRDGQRKADTGSARKGRAAQGREGKRSVARSIAVLMRASRWGGGERECACVYSKQRRVIKARGVFLNEKRGVRVCLEREVTKPTTWSLRSSASPPATPHPSKNKNAERFRVYGIGYGDKVVGFGEWGLRI